MQMLMFSNNIKYLRQLRGLKLDEMQACIGFARSTWNGYELGSSFPNFKDLIKISDFFGVSESDLIHSDLSKGKVIEEKTKPIFQEKGKVNGKVNGKVMPQKDAAYTFKEPEIHYGAPHAPAVVTVDNSGRDNIVFVPEKARGGYLSGYGDPTFLEQLPAFSMPTLRNGSYRMFEVSGHSMSPTLSPGDMVICEWVESLSQIRDNRCHVIVTADGIVVTRILNRIEKRNKIYLQSDTITHRADYPIQELDPADVLECWYVVLRVTPMLHAPSELYHRLSDLEANQDLLMRKMGLK